MIGNRISNKELRVLYIGMKYDYGDLKRGLCYEYMNLFDTMKRMKNVKTDLFAFDEILRSNGRDEMNRDLLDCVKEKKPDVCFFVLFTDEIKKETIRCINEKGNTVTLNWFTDDHWRFELYSKYWAPTFDWIVTTDAKSVEKYQKIGYSNVILSQWGFNHFAKNPESRKINMMFLLLDRYILLVGQSLNDFLLKEFMWSVGAKVGGTEELITKRW